ncbi:MAG: heme biosynthesis HemY N-terminal domain-containing protein [Sinobacteraceae bacterium]|nr:heme biosynthesis HemY N-terminal domain-containing protein [Nevskiaceae bacterium]
MIVLFLILLLVFAAGAGTILLLKPDAGYVLINYGPWVVETSLAVLVLGVALWFLIVYLLLRLLGVAVRLPGTLRASLARRREDRARASFEKGLERLFEGQWRRAEVELVRRAADHRAAHLNYLAAARAAQRQNAHARREHYLRLAALNQPAAEFATLLSAADLQRRRGDFEAARATARRLRDKDPRHPYVIELLAESEAALGDWESLHALLSDPATRSAWNTPRAAALRLRAITELMGAAAQAARLDRLKALWDSAGELRGDAELARHYARALARVNADAEALAFVAQRLAQSWDADLASLYGDLHAADPVAHLAQIEEWLARYGEKPELLAIAGRACLANKLWGKARSYLEAALHQRPSPRLCLDLARLCADTQHPDEAARYYRQGLELATADATAT